MALGLGIVEQSSQLFPPTILRFAEQLRTIVLPTKCHWPSSCGSQQLIREKSPRMEAARTTKHLMTLGLIVTLLVASGASCPRQVGRAVSAPPTVFMGAPTVEQIIQVINANTLRVHQLQTTGAKLTVEGAPSLRASMALDRPLRFRLRGETMITGSEIDLGSNDELFWVWAKRNEPPDVFYARHAEFIPGANRVLPLPPTWLIEALGLVELDPRAHYDGPYTAGPGQVEIRYVTSTPTPLTKVLIIDAQRGQILEQRVYDVTGQLLAGCHMTNYRYDAATGATLPRSIQVQLPPAQIAFSFEAEGYSINQLYADPRALFDLPQIAGSNYRDLSQ